MILLNIFMYYFMFLFYFIDFNSIIFKYNTIIMLVFFTKHVGLLCKCYHVSFVNVLVSLVVVDEIVVPFEIVVVIAEITAATIKMIIIGSESCFKNLLNMPSLFGSTSLFLPSLRQRKACVTVWCLTTASWTVCLPNTTDWLTRPRQHRRRHNHGSNPKITVARQHGKHHVVRRK